jgi:hypothetical protein
MHAVLERAAKREKVALPDALLAKFAASGATQTHRTAAFAPHTFQNPLGISKKSVIMVSAVD